MTIKLTRTRLVLAVAAIAVGIAGVSSAAIPSANGTISACKDAKGGLKVIDAEAGQTCPSNQQLLTWKQDAWVEIAPRLAEPGTLNRTDNPVDWTKLKGVPAGFADGLDNGVDKAGFGLKLNVFPALAFAVDTSKIQQRVTGTCTAGETIQSIAADGTVACAGPSVLATGINDTGRICNDFCNEGSLSLPAGTYAITAKIDLWQHFDANLRVECKLDGAGVTLDRSAATIQAGEGSRTTLPLQTDVALTSPGNVAIACTDFGEGGVYGQYLRIMAVRVA
jgi:hypothetical protein